jgi:hypothetical protein
MPKTKVRGFSPQAIPIWEFCLCGDVKGNCLLHGILKNSTEAGDSSTEGGGMQTGPVICRENVIYDV